MIVNFKDNCEYVAAMGKKALITFRFIRVYEPRSISRYDLIPALLKYPEWHWFGCTRLRETRSARIVDRKSVND